MALRMDNPIETLVGAAVLAVGVGFAVYASVPQQAATEGVYQVHALFRSATGLKPGSDVRIAGVKVGQVSAMALDSETMKAKVTLSVEKGIELSDETIAIIDSESLLGGSYVSLDPIPGFETLKQGDQIANTQGSVSLANLIAKFASGGSGENE